MELLCVCKFVESKDPIQFDLQNAKLLSRKCLIKSVKGSELKKKYDLTWYLTLQFLSECPVEKIIISGNNSLKTKLAHYFLY